LLGLRVSAGTLQYPVGMNTSHPAHHPSFPTAFILLCLLQAFAFDNALIMGRQSYLATGRFFVLKHISYPEVFLATAPSHVYAGVEAGFLLGVVTAYGEFSGSAAAFAFATIAIWLYAVALILGQTWFNPGSLRPRFAARDIGAWTRWLLAPSGTGDANVSWRAWYAKSTAPRHVGVSIQARVTRFVRDVRFLVLAALLLLHRIPPGDGGETASVRTALTAMGVLVATSIGVVVLLQLARAFHEAVLTGATSQTQPRAPVPAQARPGGPPAVASMSPTTRPHPSALTAAVMRARSPDGALSAAAHLLAVVASLVIVQLCVVDRIVQPAMGSVTVTRIDACLAFALVFWATVRILLSSGASSMCCLALGVRDGHRVIDASIGYCTLTVQLVCALLLWPLRGDTLHTALLFGGRMAEAGDLHDPSSIEHDEHRYREALQQESVAVAAARKTQ
jgi:hypothetical protein